MNNYQSPIGSKYHRCILSLPRANVSKERGYPQNREPIVPVSVQSENHAVRIGVCHVAARRRSRGTKN